MDAGPTDVARLFDHGHARAELGGARRDLAEGHARVLALLLREAEHFTHLRPLTGSGPAREALALLLGRGRPGRAAPAAQLGAQLARRERLAE